MGEYADLEIDRQMRSMFGIGYEGSQISNKKSKTKYKCPKCGKSLKSAIGVKLHLKDYHKL